MQVPYWQGLSLEFCQLSTECDLSVYHCRVTYHGIPYQLRSTLYQTLLNPNLHVMFEILVVIFSFFFIFFHLVLLELVLWIMMV